MLTTTLLSWLQFSTMWINAWCCSLFAILRATALMCQEIPLLANQSACISLYFCGRNFVAQSCVMRTEDGCRFSRRLVLALSCWIDLNRWAFHDSDKLVEVCTSSHRSLRLSNRTISMKTWSPSLSLSVGHKKDSTCHGHGHTPHGDSPLCGHLERACCNDLERVRLL